jgi:hypothetical protein
MWGLQWAKWHCGRNASLIHCRPQVPIFVSSRLRHGAGLSIRYVTSASVQRSILRRHLARLKSGYSERLGIFSLEQHPKSSLGHCNVEVSRSHTISHTNPGKTPLNEWSARRRQHTRTEQPCPLRNSNSKSQQSSGRRPPESAQLFNTMD